jgi:hypothetical protein
MSAEKEPSGKRRRIAELGPTWITAIAALIVALTSAGFFAGRATQSSGSAASGNAPIATTATSSTGDAPTATTSSASGTLLASYSINLSNSYTVPLGTAAPTLSQYVQLSMASNGDIAYLSGPVSGDNIIPGGNETMQSLPSGKAATYENCSHATVREAGVPPLAGTTFCLDESALLVGVTITAVNTNQDYVTLQVVVWPLP